MTRPTLTQQGLAPRAVCRSTICRRCEAGALPCAVSDETRGRLIPVDDLLAEGSG